MRLGVVARGDHSGLAAQTVDVATALSASAVLGVDLKDWGRGPSEWSLDGQAFRVTADRWPTDDEVVWLVDQVDVVYTAEVLGHDGIAAYCRSQDKRLVIHANPELWLPKYDHGMPTVWAPTGWRLDLLPERAVVVPMPVLDSRLVTEPRSECRRLLHIASGAMNDRNGTHQVIEAIPHITEECEVVVAGFPAQVAHFPERLNPKVRVTKLAPVTDRWALYRDCDALLLPRRYGGLCLPMLEAAALGMGIVALGSDPQARQITAWTGIPAVPTDHADTSGGRIICFDPVSPAETAWWIDQIVAWPVEHRARAGIALDWARSMAWSAHRDRWLERMAP